MPTQKTSSDSKTLPGTASETYQGNFAGRLYNLVTTDFSNIEGARDFLIVMLQVPVQITLCIWFLYAILGWR